MWVIIIVIGIVIIVWAIAGGTAPSQGSNGGPPTGQGCDACKQLPLYWKGLAFFQRFWMLSWFGWKYMDCFLRGC